MADKKIVDLGKVYQKFHFIGNLHFGKVLDVPKEQEQKGSKLTSYGWKDVRTGISKTNKAYKSRSLKLSIETVNKDKAYLDLDDFTMEGQSKSVYFTKKGTKKSENIDYKLATDKAVLDASENWTIKKIEVGSFKHETLHLGTFIDTLEDNLSLIDELNDTRVVVDGNIEFSEYEGNTQMKYKVSSIRNPYPNEDDKLGVTINAIYVKDSIKLPKFADLANEEFVKIPMDFSIPTKSKKFQVGADGKRVYEVDLLPSRESIGLNVSMIDFSKAEHEDMYTFMGNLLNTKQELDANGKMTEVALEPMQAYMAKFVGEVKTTSKGGDLKMENLTTPEKFYIQIKQKTLEDIKRERGIKQVSNSMVLIDAIPYDCTEVDTSDKALHKAPMEVSASEAFTQPQTQTAPPQAPTGIPTGIPSFNMGTFTK